MRITSFALSLGLCLVACSSCSRTQTTTSIEDSIAESQPNSQNPNMEDDLNKSRTILYTLPAPVEMAAIIQQTGVKFDDMLLANLSKASQYNTNLKMALNLGIYASDMSVSGMFNQSQRMVDYLNVMKQLTSKLGIVKVLDEDAIRKLEGSNVTKEEALNVISEVYMNTNQYLTENNRQSVATIVMTGGWLEGLYLALNLVDSKKLNKNTVERLVSQKLAMITMMNIIESTNKNSEDEDLKYIYTKMNEIKQIFDLVNIEKVGRVSALTDMETHTTTIKANTSGTLDTNILEALKAKVSAVRNEFIE